MTYYINTAIDHNEQIIFGKNTSASWQANDEYNLMYLKAQQRYLNDLLQARGHVFLNEVYDAFGFDRTPAGAVLGWLYSENNVNVDVAIEFKATDFVNTDIHLAIKPFGVIFDKI